VVLAAIFGVVLGRMAEVEQATTEEDSDCCGKEDAQEGEAST
jgi:hypothetical protein